MVGGLRKRPRAGLALPCSPCSIWSRSGISNSFDRKRAPVDGALMRRRLHCDYGNGVLSMPRVGATAPPSAEPPPVPYFAMKSKARSEPLWIGCQHSTGSPLRRRHRGDLLHGVAAIGHLRRDRLVPALVRERLALECLGDAHTLARARREEIRRNRLKFFESESEKQRLIRRQRNPGDWSRLPAA